MTARRLFNRVKASPNVFLLRDESLEESDNLPDPDVLAMKSSEIPEAALEQFRAITADVSAHVLADRDQKHR
jgi:type I restriction enzyme M protein